MSNPQTMSEAIGYSPDSEIDDDGAALSVRVCCLIILGVSVLCYGAMLGAISALSAGLGGN